MEVSNCCGSQVITPDWEMAEQMGSLARAYTCYICKECGQPCEPIKKDKNMKVIQNIHDPEFFAQMNMTDIDIYSKISKNPLGNPNKYNPQPVKWVKDINEACRFSDANGVEEVVKGMNILSQCLGGRDLARCVEFTPENTSAKIDVGASQINPPHYQSDKMQAIDVIEAFGLGFDLGNAVKYILRAGKKDAEEKELRKAIWYIMHHLGWEPQKNQSMAEEFLTNEKLEIIDQAYQILKNYNKGVGVSATQVANKLKERFPLE